jgi:hypothetical protein
MLLARRCMRLGLKPQAERAKDAKSVLKLSILQDASPFQPDGFSLGLRW